MIERFIFRAADSAAAALQLRPDLAYAHEHRRFGQNNEIESPGDRRQN
jgi:hypothetical protein